MCEFIISHIVLVTVKIYVNAQCGFLFFMKRENNLLSKIADFQNLRLAFLKSMRGKRNSSEAILFCQNIDENLLRLQTSLLDGTYKMQSYNFFKIYDPKERMISAACFEDRIVHHAIINILEPIFERQSIFHTYACRKNKGLHKAVQYAFKKSKSNQYFLKLDIKKYFDNINHTILKIQLSRIIKDKKCLHLLFEIIDSYSLVIERVEITANKGLPIGNLTSQFFANLYLSSFDHFVLEELKPNGFVRYMDDFLIFGDSISELKFILKKCENFLSENLDLSLKFAIFGKCTNGIPFLGRLIKPKLIDFLRIKKKRKLKKIKIIDNEYNSNKISQEKACEILCCLFSERKI